MIAQQTIADFYTLAKPTLRPPGSLRSGGHFTVYRLEDFCFDPEPSSVFSRKDFYKITLAAASGDLIYHYADQQRHLTAGEFALVFTDTHQAYSWEMNGAASRGYCCLFTADFLPTHTHLHPDDLQVFAPQAPTFFYLTAPQATDFGTLFEKMLAEQDSPYPQKYELLFHYLMTCVHEAQKLVPAADAARGTSAAARLTTAFQELLARQFPIFMSTQRVELRTAQAFADQLAVHVNYLSRTLKEETGKTTTQLLAERLVQEARALLLHTDWPIADIGYCLGFEEPTHFTQFFRRHTQRTPSQLRQEVRKV